MSLSEPSGLLILNKPIGITSHDCVYKIRRLYSTKRVGHTGTLDPLATGVLVMLVGRAAKAAEYLSADTKGYVATLRLGITTDTEDITGKILTESHDIPSADKVRAVANGFLGDIKQIPPMYSAIKVDGKKLYDLAREGITVEREARDVTVHSLSVTPTDDNSKYTLSVECSSGTYIRTLCADIGNALGSGGVMETLLRTRVGDFKLSESHTIEELEAMSEDERISLLLPVEKLFYSLSSVYLPEFYEKLCRNGCEIYEKKIKTHFSVGERVKLYSEKGDFFALGEVREYPDGTAIKAIKTFEL